MGQHHALGHARAAAGVHDDGGRGGARRRGLGLHTLQVVVGSLLAEADHVPVRDELQVAAEAVSLGSPHRVLEVDNPLDLVLVGEDLGELGQELGGGDHGLHLGLEEAVPHRVLAQVGVQGHHGQGLLETRLRSRTV